MSVTIIEGNVNGLGLKVGVVAARWNAFVTNILLDGAIDVLDKSGVRKQDITIVRCPGAFEIPLAAQKLLEKGVDGVVCLGAVIRGGTPHFEYVSLGVTRGIADLALKFSKPVIFGVLTTDTVDQAMERAGGSMGNKGAEAASALLEMCNLVRELK